MMTTSKVSYLFNVAILWDVCDRSLTLPYKDVGQWTKELASIEQVLQPMVLACQEQSKEIDELLNLYEQTVRIVVLSYAFVSFIPCGATNTNVSFKMHIDGDHVRHM